VNPHKHFFLYAGDLTQGTGVSVLCFAICSHPYTATIIKFLFMECLRIVEAKIIKQLLHHVDSFHLMTLVAVNFA
jgi:hypothetical protein